MARPRKRVKVKCLAREIMTSEGKIFLGDEREILRVDVQAIQSLDKEAERAPRIEIIEAK